MPVLCGPHRFGTAVASRTGGGEVREYSYSTSTVGEGE